MRKLWKRLGFWLFGFDLDHEFLRGVAFGRQQRDEEIVDGNYYLRFTTPADGTSAPTSPFRPYWTGDDPNRPQNTCSTVAHKDGAGA